MKKHNGGAAKNLEVQTLSSKPPPGVDHEYTSMSVRLWEGQLDLIKKAAESQGLTLSNFVREVMVPHAARVLGVPCPTFPEFLHGRVSPASALAKRMGVATDALRKHVLEMGIEQLMARIDSDEPEETPATHMPRETVLRPGILRRRRAVN